MLFATHNQSKCEQETVESTTSVKGRRQTAKKRRYLLKSPIYTSSDSTGPFSCMQCSKAFRDFASLLQHMQMKEAHRPYWCNDCLTSFWPTRLSEQSHEHPDPPDPARPITQFGQQPAEGVVYEQLSELFCSQTEPLAHDHDRWRGRTSCVACFWIQSNLLCRSA